MRRALIILALSLTLGGCVKDVQVDIKGAKVVDKQMTTVNGYRSTSTTCFMTIEKNGEKIKLEITESVYNVVDSNVTVDVQYSSPSFKVLRVTPTKFVEGGAVDVK
jgi:hypothetical protein